MWLTALPSRKRVRKLLIPKGIELYDKEERGYAGEEPKCRRCVFTHCEFYAILKKIQVKKERRLGFDSAQSGGIFRVKGERSHWKKSRGTRRFGACALSFLNMTSAVVSN